MLYEIWNVSNIICTRQKALPDFHNIHNKSQLRVPLCVRAKSLQSCPTLRHHRQQPTRLRRPWDSPGKNTGVGCHFLLQCMNEKSESEVSQSCPTPSNPMDCSLPDSSVHGISRQEYWSGVPLPSPKNSLVISNSNSCTSVSKPNWIKRAKKRNQFPTLTPLHL